MPFYLQEFDPNCIHSFLELLTPARARLTWATRSHESQQQQQQQGTCATDSAAPDGSSSSSSCGTSAAPAAAVLPPPELTQEPIYSTKYAVCRIPCQWMGAWTNSAALPGLHLPAANPFVPSDLSLRAEAGEMEGVPQLLVDGPSARIWQRTELRFGSPKATIVLDVQVGLC
jgi:insulysin